MDSEASASVVTPSGVRIHLLGVSHNSALYGKLAHKLISQVQPDAVVLEVDENRLREQAQRGRQWLVQQDRHGVVRRALQPFLEEGSIWASLTDSDHRRHSRALQNEGAALLEGGVYGGEVIMACEAATSCGADIVLADRAKRLSNARLLAARQQERLQRLQRMPDDDWTLVKLAAGMAANRIAQHLQSLLAPLAVSEAQAFADNLHPIFLVAEEPRYRSVLEAVGCDAHCVVAAVERLLHRGTSESTQICPADVSLVQDSIERIERQKHRMRSHALACSYSSDAEPAADTESRSPSIAQCVQQAVSSAAAAAGARSDAFSRWCVRGAGHMFSFDPREHGLACASAAAELESADSEPAAGAVTPYYRTTVYERDCILAHRIQSVAEEQGAKNVVAVVGANHLPGILRRWSQSPPASAVEAECAQFLSAPAAPQQCSAAERESLWKLHAVEGLSTCMEAGAALAAAAVPACLSRALPKPWRLAPLAAAGAAVCASLACSDARQRRMAQLVQNLAVHQDSVARLQTAV